MKLGEYLEAERARRGVSKRTFAAALGISHAEYIKINRGTHAPRLAALDSISRGTGLSLPRVLELAGYDLRLPSDLSRSDRIEALAARDPRLQAVVDQLLRLPGSDLDAVLAKIEQDLGRDGQAPA